MAARHTPGPWKAQQLPYPDLPRGSAVSMAALETFRHAKATWTAAKKSEPLAMVLSGANITLTDSVEKTVAELQRAGGLLYGWTGTTLTAADLPERGQRCIVEVVA